MNHLISSQAAMEAPQVDMPFADEAQLLAALRNGDETAFVELIDRYHPAMVRLAMAYVGSRVVAEDVAQESWIGVLRGLGSFEGRSSLKTWIFRILINRAKTRAEREGRYIPFSDIGDLESDEPSVPAEYFDSPANAPESGHWTTKPSDWESLPEEHLLAQETRDQIQRAIDDLPTSQRQVITMRDIEGWKSEEVCNVLDISETNQRVLLHRARSKVRRALAAYLGD